MHLVTPELDAGPIVAQASVPVLDEDTVETLSARILGVEHAIYPEAVDRLLTQPWRVDGRRVVAPLPPTFVMRDGRPWLTIRNPACCAKTFPDFFDLLEQLRVKSSGA